jgi:TP901 family phage tail tape measure protein
MAVELATAYVSIVPSGRGIGKALDAELGAAGSSGAKSFGAKFTGGMAGIGKLAGAGLGVALVGAAGIGKALFDMGASFDDAYDKIRTGTGSTGAALTGLQDDLKAVATAVPTSFDDASTAITDLNKRLGLTGVPLQDLSAQFLDLSRVTGTDLTTNIDTLSRVFGDWGVAVEDQAGTLDKVFRASQESGIGIDALGQSVVQFGAPLRNLGFGFDESVALLAKFSKEGVNTETVFAGMKAGVGKLAKAGEDVPATFRRVVDEITKLGPGTEATAKSIELFGQRAGPDLADAIAGGKFEVGGMLDAIANGSDTIGQAGEDTADFGEKLQMLKNKVLIKLEPIALRVFGAIGDAVERVAPLADEIAGGFLAAFAAFTDGGDEVTSSGLAGTLEGIGVKLRDVFDKVGPVVGDVVETIKGIDWAKVLGDVADVVGPIVTAFVDLAVAVADFAVEQWPKVEAVLPTVKTLVETLGSGFATTIGFIADHFTVLGPALAAVAVSLLAIKTAEVGAAKWTALKDGVTGASDKVKHLNTNFDQFLAKSKSIGGAGKSAASSGLDTIRLKAMYAGDKLKAAATSAATFGSKVKTAVVDKATAAGTALKTAGTKALEFGKSMVTSAVGVAKSTAAFIANKAALVAQKIALAASAVATGIATGATAAFNFVMALNPVLLVVLAIVALIAILVLAYTKVDWFRAFVDKAFSMIKDAAVWVFSKVGEAIGGAVDGAKRTVQTGFALVKAFIVDPVLAAKDKAVEILDGLVSFFKDLPDKLGKGLSKLADVVGAPFKAMAKAIKDIWNDTIGGKGFSIPDIPGIPGGGTDFKIPKLHAGSHGPIAGRSGQEVVRILEAGEWVLSRDEVANIRSGARPPASLLPVGGDIGGGGQTINVKTVANASADEVVDAINAKLSWAHTTRRDR